MLTFNKQNISIFIIWLFAISAIIGIYLGYVSWFIPKTPLNLMLGAGLLFWNFPINSLQKIGVWCIAFSIGMLVEIIGVQTGDIFGNYYYGENLGIKFMGVPFLIGVNWAVLSFITAAIGSRLTKSFWGSIFLGACFMLGLDFLLEPLAGVFDFWHFEGGIVPIQNYIAWFVTAFLLQILIRKTMDFQKPYFSTHLFLSQVIFFGSCYLILF
ncbi:MAG: carotenoid biosynthesis protein [Saprospiraceae bacterium]